MDPCSRYAAELIVDIDIDDRPIDRSVDGLSSGRLSSSTLSERIEHWKFKKKREKKQLKQKERNFFDCFLLFVVVVVLSISHLFFYGLNPVFFIIELYRVVLDFLGFEIKIV